MFLLIACAGSLFAGCASPTSPIDESQLSPDDLARARAVPSHGDVVYRLDEHEYVGSAAIQVHTGAVEEVSLRFTAFRSAPTQSLGGEIRLPEDDALQLASHGWNFEMADSEAFMRTDIYNLAGEELIGFRFARVSIRAQPDGLFVMDMDLTRGSETEHVSAAGRLTGGCAFIDDEGSVLGVADVSTVARCQSVLGSF